MRLRHIPGAEQMIEESPFVIQDARERKGRWQESLGAKAPLQIEIGMGKGRFILEQARKNPDLMFLGIERYSTVLLKALRKRGEEEAPNLFYLCEDARKLGEIFGPGEVERIYLNFSDPWPKKRNAGRRLTSPVYLGIYEQFLTADGTVEFKTDNRDLFEYSLESIGQAGWRILASTFDLYASDLAAGNVMTEYEMKFAAEGKPICKLIAARREPEEGDFSAEKADRENGAHIL